MDIYTAQYRYSGPDRVDITVKGADPVGKVLAPTWEMVQAYKVQKLTDWDYAIKYFSLLSYRFLHENAPSRNALATLGLRMGGITLVCFCPSGSFCHRILAANMLENWGVGKYVGERIF